MNTAEQPDDQSSLAILRRVFGYESFRHQQREIIERTLSGGDSVVLMPTGGGKSLCYQIPAIIRPGVGVIISPLIALMQDQVDTLVEYGVRAAYINSTLSFEEQARVQAKIRAQELDLLYIAPERLASEEFFAFLCSVNVALFAIDEAHCVSQWGHDFRPDYLKLDCLKEHFSGVPRMALTATADEPTRKDIFERLNLQDAKLFSTGFDRPNIRYHVQVKSNARQQLLSFIREEHQGDAGIVYCMSRKKVEKMAEWLSKQGLRALPYHAGLDPRMREEHQRTFLQEEGVIVVATIAFGMGIDKSNVRFVAHLDLPKSLEAYYQETGRAGRDGLPSSAWMVYGLGDVVALRQMLASSGTDQEQKFIEHRKLGSLLGFCETTDCRRHVLLRYFGEDAQGKCGNCDTCLTPVDSWDGSLEAQKALSCIYRTGQRFGVTYLVDVLVGKETERIVQFGHNHLSLFGSGSDRSHAEWTSIFRQLIAFGYITIDLAGYGGLQLAPECKPILQGEQQVHFRHDPHPRKSKQTATSHGASSKEKVNFESSELLKALRAKRMFLAKKQGVPPYVIFHDKTLLQMSQELPSTLEEFSQISGVGESKLAKYGDIFLELLNEHRSKA